MLTLTSRGRALATLALIAASAPAFAAAPAARLTTATEAGETEAAPSGVFRVEMQEDGKGPVPAAIILERRGGKVEATLVVDERAMQMRVVRADAGTLQASVTTEHGPGELTLRVDGDLVNGTLTAKKHAWTVSGERSV